jgi:hypothetical protein
MKPKTKTILFILLSFVLGMLAGWFAESHLNIKPARQPKNFQQILTERLNLDARQIVLVDSILDVRKKQMNLHRKEMLAMRDTLQMEIRKVLSADQNKLFDALIREMDNKDTQKRAHESEK